MCVSACRAWDVATMKLAFCRKRNGALISICGTLSPSPAACCHVLRRRVVTCLRGVLSVGVCFRVAPRRPATCPVACSHMSPRLAVTCLPWHAVTCLCGVLPQVSRVMLSRVLARCFRICREEFFRMSLQHGSKLIIQSFAARSCTERLKSQTLPSSLSARLPRSTVVQSR